MKLRQFAKDRNIKIYFRDYVWVKQITIESAQITISLKSREINRAFTYLLIFLFMSKNGYAVFM